MTEPDLFDAPPAPPPPREVIQIKARQVGETIRLAAESEKSGGFHFAKVENSPRLQELLAYLRKCGADGATTMEIAMACRIYGSVSEATSALRHNGFQIDSIGERVTGGGRKVYRYYLREGVANG